MKFDHRNNPIDSANTSFKRSSRNRFIAAVGITLICLVLLVFIGPNAEKINKKFEYLGAQGELKIMDAISIVDGTDQVHQMPKSLQAPPPPAILEIEEDVVHDDGEREIPKPEEEQLVENPVIQEVVDQKAEEFSRELVSMATPIQTSRNYYIKTMVRPEYPLDATEEERNTPVIFVDVQFFFTPDGKVSACMIQNTNGGKAFTTEVIEKMNQWIIGFYNDPGPGLWMETTWKFKSPYFTHSLDSGR